LKTPQKEKRKYAWEVVYHKAIDNGVALWPSYFSVEKLDDIRRRFQDVGLTHKFAQEYLNEARDLTNAKFKIDRLVTYDGEFVSNGNFAYIVDKEDAIPVNVYIGVDLAYEANENSDFQVIMVVGVDSDKNVYIIDYFRERIPLYEMPDEILQYAKEYSPIKRANVELVGAQGIIKDAVNQLSGGERKMMPGLAKGVRPPSGIKKEDRLESLVAPIVNRGKMHIKRKHQDLVDEMFQFPKGKNDDLAPISRRFEAKDMDDILKKQDKKRAVKRAISWMTGQKL
jgi:predicted phage terminase large subunit-like protein